MRSTRDVHVASLTAGTGGAYFPNVSANSLNSSCIQNDYSKDGIIYPEQMQTVAHDYLFKQPQQGVSYKHRRCKAGKVRRVPYKFPRLENNGTEDRGDRNKERETKCFF